MSEAVFTADFKKYLKEKKKEHGSSFFFYKVSDRFTSGIPDFFIAYRGNVAYVELKDLGKSPDDIQLFTMERLQRAGVIAVWFDSLEPAKRFIDELIGSRLELRL